MRFYSYLRKIGSFLLVLTIFYYIFNFVDLEKLRKLVFISNNIYLFIGFILTLLWPFIACLRWRSTLRGFNLDVPFKKIFSSIMISFSTNLIAPAKMGDFLKMFVMGKEYDKYELASAVVSERIGDLLVLLIFSIFGSIYILNFLYFNISVSFFILLILLIVLFSKIKIKFSNYIINKIVLIAASSFNLWSKNTIAMKNVVFFSSLNWLLASIQIYIFFLAFDANISFFTVLSVFPLTVLISLIPVTPGGVGIREASFLFLFYSYADLHVNIAVSLCYFICTSCITTGIGAVYVTFFNRKSF